MTQKTIVELVDTSTGPGHVVKEVRVNGMPVRVAEGGVDVEYGPNEVTKVHLTLLPDAVHFHNG